MTLEPCNHSGRTGPCAEALVAAGVARVVFAQADPNPVAAGGADTLRGAGLDVAHGLLADEARAVNRVWTFAVEHGRPFVTWKFAATLDGRSAAADGTSRWVSSPAAREDTHRLRALCDVILAGTGTVLVDDPELTVRDAEGTPLPWQPLRAVMGLRAGAGRPPCPQRRRGDRRAPDPGPGRGARRPVRPGPPARLPRGRAHPGGGVPPGRARRRGGRLRRPDAPRRRAERGRRPRDHHPGRRDAPRGRRHHRPGEGPETNVRLTLTPNHAHHPTQKEH